MFRRIVVCFLLTVFLLTVAEAQQTKKVPRIGYLTGSSLSANAARIEAFRQGLRDLGYEEGKNVLTEWRAADGKIDHLPTVAAELVRLKLDVIVTSGPTGTRAVKDATSTTPIVMTFDSDPVGHGFVATLARPGGNITGLSTPSPQLRGKRLELLKEIISKLSRVAVFQTSSTPGNAQVLTETNFAAEALGVKLQYLEVRIPKTLRMHSVPQPRSVLKQSSC